MPANSKWFRAHMAELDSRTYSEGSIRGLRKKLREQSFIDEGYSRPRSSRGSVTREELDAIVARIADEHPTIGDKQAAKGIAWLRKTVFKKNGQPRGNCSLGSYELRIVREFKWFELVDLYDVGKARGAFVSDFHPVYRVVGGTGIKRDELGHFDYVAGSWQSGVPFEVVG